ncbi:MAG TPA: response regulator [Chloroflexi bacterium]|nr:response regulator [Chloroflexota bacterium]
MQLPRPPAYVEIDEARNSLLFSTRIIVFIYGFLWFWWALFQIPDLVDVLPSIICLFGFLVTDSHVGVRAGLSRVVITCSLITAIDISIISHPSHLVVALLTIPFLLGSLLLSLTAVAALMLANWVILFRLWGAMPAELVQAYGAFSLALSIVVLTVGWIAIRSLADIIERYASGWQHARLMLHQVQDRRREIYRALHSLEEAMVRVERMNNELVLAQQQVESANEAKTRFVNTVSHELRAPLNLILGFSRLMVISPESYGEPLPKPYRADMDVIYRNAQHLVELVDDVLDLGKIEARQLPLVKDVVNIRHDVVDPAAEIARPLALRKGLRFEVTGGDGIPTILADKVRLRQVLINLLMNAIRCTEDGSINITLRHEQEAIAIVVRDTGIGISEQDIPRLFNEFSQISQARSEKTTGLGLLIAKHLVELHGGRISVESQLGEGTTFLVELPAPDIEPVSQITMTDRVQRSAKHDTILVLQQDPGVIRTLSRYLEGYHLVGLPRVDGLKEHVDASRPRAVLTGIETERAAKKAMLDLDVRVPLITCEWPRDNPHNSAHLISYMVKPLSPTAIRDAMASLYPEPQECVNIVIVDDDPAAVRLLERILTALPHPYAIRKAYSGAQALGILREKNTDVAFLDLIMPDLDGWQILDAIQREGLGDVAVIMVTGQDLTQGIRVGEELRVWHRGMSFSQAIGAISTLVGTLSPDYQLRPTRAESPPGGPLG